LRRLKNARIVGRVAEVLRFVGQVRACLPKATRIFVSTSESTGGLAVSPGEIRISSKEICISLPDLRISTKEIGISLREIPISFVEIHIS